MRQPTWGCHRFNFSLRKTTHIPLSRVQSVLFHRMVAIFGKVSMEIVKAIQILSLLHLLPLTAKHTCEQGDCRACLCVFDGRVLFFNVM